MIAIIGEVIAEFYPADVEEGEEVRYSYSVGGSAVDAASRLEDAGIADFEIVSKFSNDNLGIDEHAMLEDLDWTLADIDPSPLLSPVDINGDIRLRNTAAATITTEELSLHLAKAKPDAVVLSAALLSLNPSASAIVDAVLFMDNKPLIIVDLGEDDRLTVSLEILKDSLNKLASSDKAYKIGDRVETKLKTISRDSAIERLKSIN